MRTLARIAFGICAGISAALLLAVVVLWVHSYRTIELLYQLKTLDRPTAIYPELGLRNPDVARRELEFGVACGSLSLTITRMFSGGMYPAEMPAPDGWRQRSLPAAQASFGFPRLPQRTLGIGCEHNESRPDDILADVLQLRGAAASQYQNLPPVIETWTRRGGKIWLRCITSCATCRR